MAEKIGAPNVAVGDTVIVTTGMYRKAKPERYTVVKVARVWITVQREGADRPEWTERKFRLDTQTDGGDIGVPDMFYTLAQWQERELQERAEQFLREQGIDLRWESPWRGRVVELADIITAALAAADSTPAGDEAPA